MQFRHLLYKTQNNGKSFLSGFEIRYIFICVYGEEDLIATHFPINIDDTFSIFWYHFRSCLDYIVKGCLLKQIQKDMLYIRLS